MERLTLGGVAHGLPGGLPNVINKSAEQSHISQLTAMAYVRNVLEALKSPENTRKNNAGPLGRRILHQFSQACFFSGSYAS
jgi:hypothetical protein